MTIKYDKENIFAKILRGELSADLIHENDYAIAFKDINPAAKEHVLVVPKGEYVSFDDYINKAHSNTVKRFFQTVKEVADKLGINESGYRLITNHGNDGNQTVPHFHVHLLGGEPLKGF